MTETAAIVERPEAEGDLDLQMVELFFFAYRDFIAEADALLAQSGFGRAHHRVLHFVNHHPGLPVARVLDILKITKQSLGPVLKQLVEAGLLAQRAGEKDRRQRLLFPTRHGRDLSLQLTAMQSRRVRAALATLGSRDRRAIEAFLMGMVDPAERAMVTGLMERDFGSFGGQDAHTATIDTKRYG